MLFWIFAFILSLVILIKSSDLFTEYAEKLGIVLNLPSYVVGVLILSIGTSLPELVSSVIASLNKQSDIILGNIIGSNIANILLIVGIAAIVSKKIRIFQDIEYVDLPFLFGTTILLLFAAYDGKIDLLEGFLFLILFIVYSKFSITHTSREMDKEMKKQFRDVKESKKKIVFYLIITPILIYLSADWVIESIIKLSQLTGISESVISSTALAVGTSLPELMVTVSATRRDNQEMAIGNIIGSNIFNILLILGLCSIINPITITGNMIYFELEFLSAITVLFILSALTKKITLWEGYFYLVLYLFFIFKIVL